MVVNAYHPAVPELEECRSKIKGDCYICTKSEGSLGYKIQNQPNKHKSCLKKIFKKL